MSLHEGSPVFQVFGVADFRDPPGIILKTSPQRVGVGNVVLGLVPSGRNASLGHDLLSTSTKGLVASHEHCSGHDCIRGLREV